MAICALRMVSVSVMRNVVILHGRTYMPCDCTRMSNQSGFGGLAASDMQPASSVRPYTMSNLIPHFGVPLLLTYDRPEFM